MDEKNDLSLEKLRINDRLRDVELQTARIVSHLDSEKGTWTRYTESIHKSLERLETIVLRHDELLIGSEKGAGFITKIDRLEIVEKNKAWHTKAIWIMILGLVGSFVTFVGALFYRFLKG